MKHEQKTLQELPVAKVYEIIRLSLALRAAEVATQPEEPDFDTWQPGVASLPTASDKVVQPLADGIAEVIDGMTKPEKAEVLALIWSGRGDAGNFSDLITSAYCDADETTGEYLVQMSPLADYLQAGLQRLGLPAR